MQTYTTMIPQEKIDAASLNNTKLHYVMAFSDDIHIDADMDFQAGVRFAEQELQSVAMEFAGKIIDYIDNEAEVLIPVDKMFNEDGSHITKKQFGIVVIKELCVELRAKFMAESEGEKNE